MTFNNTEIDTQPLIQEYKPEPTWGETYKASVKNFTSVHLSTSSRNYYDDGLEENYPDWIAAAPEKENVFKRVMNLGVDVVENYENLYSKGKLDVIASDRGNTSPNSRVQFETSELTGGLAFLQYKEMQKEHGFKDLIAIKSESNDKAKSDYLESGKVLAESDSWSAKLAGGAVGVMSDPITLATLPVGSWKTGGTIMANAARAFGEEALIETAAQAVIAPNVYAFKKELDIKTSLKDEVYTALTSIATAGMFRTIGSAGFDLTASGIKALKAKDPSMAKDYEELIKGQKTEGVEGHIDNLHKTEFGDSQVTEIKDPNAEGQALNQAEPIREYGNHEEMLLKQDVAPIEDLSLVIGKTEDGMPQMKSYKELELEYDNEDTILTNLQNCLKGAL